MIDKPWFCHLQPQISQLEWWEKPSEYLLDKKKSIAKKKLLDEQAPGHLKTMIAALNFKVFMVQMNVKIDSTIKYKVERYQDKLLRNASVETLPEDEEENPIGYKIYRFSYYEISRIVSYLNHSEVERARRISKAFNYGTCFAVIDNLQRFRST